MKRKVTKKTDSIDDVRVQFALNKIDEAVAALNRNEDEIVRVMDELMSRKLSEKDISTLKSNYELYSKSTKNLKDVIGD